MLIHKDGVVYFTKEFRNFYSVVHSFPSLPTQQQEEELFSKLFPLFKDLLEHAQNVKKHLDSSTEHNLLARIERRIRSQSPSEAQSFFTIIPQYAQSIDLLVTWLAQWIRDGPTPLLRGFSTRKDRWEHMFKVILLPQLKSIGDLSERMSGLKHHFFHIMKDMKKKRPDQAKLLDEDETLFNALIDNILSW